MKLSIPHITQAGNAIRGDCGPACVAMCAGVTIDDVYNTGIVKRGDFAHITKHIRPCLYYYGINSWFTRYDAGSIRLELSHNHQPAICLIEYGRLPADLKRDQDYNGTHFVLAVGCDDNHILIHDPLGSAETGAYVPYPDDALNHALRDGQCLVVMREYPIVRGEETAVSPALQLRVIFKRLGVSNLGDALVRIGELERERKKRLHEPL